MWSVTSECLQPHANLNRGRGLPRSVVISNQRLRSVHDRPKLTIKAVLWSTTIDCANTLALQTVVRIHEYDFGALSDRQRVDEPSISEFKSLAASAISGKR